MNGVDSVWDVCRLLNEAGAAYVVVGQCASLLHGYVRDTQDLDVMIPRDLANARIVLEALEALPLKIAREHSAAEVISKPFTILGDMPRVDLLIGFSPITYESTVAHHVRFEVDGVSVPCLSLDHLIDMKRRSARDKDRIDAAALERIRAKRVKAVGDGA